LTLLKQAPPKEQITVYREVGTDELEVTMTGSRTDGKPIATKAISPRQGGTVKMLQGDLPDGMTLVATRIDANNSYLTFMMNGKQVLASQGVISKDGKVMRVTIRGTDAQGKPVEHLLVSAKQ
jgi:hypothetical protein